MTEDNPYGWQDQDQVFTNSVDGLVYTGKKVLSVGQAPMNIVNIAGAVTFKGLAQDRSFRTVVLDENGYIKADGSSQALGTNLQVILPANALYTVLLDTGAVHASVDHQPAPKPGRGPWDERGIQRQRHRFAAFDLSMAPWRAASGRGDQFDPGAVQRNRGG